MVWTKMGHRDAEVTCKASGGTLVTIKNAIDNQAVYNFANQGGVEAIWIGISCFGNTSSSCFWDDASGSAVSYNNFPAGSIYAPCTSMQTGDFQSLQGKWITRDCYDYSGMSMFSPMPFVCEVPSTVKPWWMAGCVNNYNRYCYVKSMNLGMGTENRADTGTNADRICKSFGRNLPSIHSKMEVDYIRNLYNGTNTTHVYIGGQAGTGDRFNWLDGTAWDFNYMDPLNIQKGNCLVMDVQGDGLWSQEDCSQKFEYLCKSLIITDPTPAPLTTKTPGNPEIESAKESKLPENLLDASNCNSTLLLAPGSIFSFGYPNAPSSYCTWQIRALGPYRLGIYFNFWATYGALNISDQYGNNIGSFSGTYNRTPFPRYTPFNIATVTFEPRPKTGSEEDKGFHAEVLMI
ncbi:hypothetical protein L3Y34_019756 [Caenorhabditis briggsae]|nr:hypothetical protein L3Y34_019756 [Caenorhabditis briggsae]